LLGFLILVAYVLLARAGYIIAQRGVSDARHGIQHLAELLQKHAARELSLPHNATPETLTETSSEWEWQYMKFDSFGYSIEVRGEHPKYAGTIITYHGKDFQHPILLVVDDLAEGEWDLREFPRPTPWWAWGLEQSNEPAKTASTTR